VKEDLEAKRRHENMQLTKYMKRRLGETWLKLIVNLLIKKKKRKIMRMQLKLYSAVAKLTEVLIHDRKAETVFRKSAMATAIVASPVHGAAPAHRRICDWKNPYD